MEVDSWDQAQRLFLSAVDLSPAELEQFLEASCAGDSELRAEVESLLIADRKNGAGIASAVEIEASLLFDSPLSGERLGAYRILHEIGRGGMGAVYLAVRDDELYRKKVAIKVVKRGMDTTEVLSRFRYERQILANLDHPYIAGLYDGGTTHDGRPFFVMEFVEGQPVDAFCRERALSVEARCRLFVRICEAVAHAHRNLVVHRDLKPANIFVTPEGTPKLLDFGIAKLLGDGGGDRETTAAMARHLTPDYASPEQVRGLAVTTATDVYSLGSVLYELLTGRRAHQITGGTPGEVERAVCETEILRPSVHAPHLDADLDNIVQMAMRKEPGRRYLSAEQFAEDIRRYLEARPVLARKDSLWYRTRRFARRRRYALGASAAILASLVCGVVIAFSQAREARAARDVAISERQRAEERLAQIVNLSNYSLSDVYALMERLPGAIPARKEMLSAMLIFLENLSKQPGTDDRLKFALAKAYVRLGDLQGDPDSANIGDTAGALKSFQAASGLLGQSPQVTAEKFEFWEDLQDKLAKIHTEMGERATARDILEKAIRVVESSPGAGRNPSPGKAELYLSLSRNTFDLPRALELGIIALKEASASAQRTPGDTTVQILLSATNTQVGFVHWLMGDPEAAEAPYRECIRIREQLVRDHPEDILYRRYLKLSYEHFAALEGGSDRVNLGHPEIARAYYRKAQPFEEAALADPQNSLAKFDYASYLFKAASVDVPPAGLAESVAMLRKALANFESLDHAQPGLVRNEKALADTRRYLGHRLLAMGTYREALAEYTQAQDLYTRTRAHDPENQALLTGILQCEKGITQALMFSGDRNGALEHAHLLLRRAEGNEPWRGEAYLTLAMVHRQFSDCDQARQAAEKSVEHLRPQMKGTRHDPLRPVLHDAQALLAECSVLKTP